MLYNQTVFTINFSKLFTYVRDHVNVHLWPMTMFFQCEGQILSRSTQGDEVYKLSISIWRLETVQDFLIKLYIKPLMHLLEKSIFSLNNDLVRLTKIMNNLVKDLKILSFKVIFKCLKLVESFQKKFLWRNMIRRPTYINEIFWKL